MPDNGHVLRKALAISVVFRVCSRCHHSLVSACCPLRIFPSVSGSALLTPEVDTRLAWPINTSSHFNTDIGQVGSGPSGANESPLQPCPCLWTYSLQGDGHLCLPSRESRSDGGQSELRDGERGSRRPMGVPPSQLEQPAAETFPVGSQQTLLSA